MTRIAWMIERKIDSAGKGWAPFKLAGDPGDYMTRAWARREAAKLNDDSVRHRRGCLWEYRAVPYLPRVDSTGRRR